MGSGQDEAHGGEGKTVRWHGFVMLRIDIIDSSIYAVQMSLFLGDMYQSPGLSLDSILPETLLNHTEPIAPNPISEKVDPSMVASSKPTSTAAGTQILVGMTFLH